MISRPDLFDGGNQYENNSDQFNSREEEMLMVIDNFDVRRKHSAEGYRVKIGKLDDYVTDWVIIQEHSNPLHEERDVRQMHVPVNIEFERGFYVYWLGEPWIVFSEKRYIDGAYWSVQIRKCNYLMKWIDTVTRQIVESWVVLMSKNSYSSGVWSNTFSQYVDGETACVIPMYGDNVKRIKRGDRRLISNNNLHPISYYVSNLKDVLMEGCMVLNFEEDEPSPVFDDYENMIADRWKYENTYKIIVLNGDSFSVGLTQNAQIQVKVEAHNELMDTTSMINSPTLLFKPVNENVVRIFEDGTIQPITVGSTFVDIFIMSNASEKASVITQKRIEITVVNETVVENTVVIKGGSTIFFDAKSKYSATLLKNGLEVIDTFEFELLNDIGLSLSNKIAKLINVQDATCEIQAFDINENIVLSVKSLSTDVVETKIITIRDIL